MRVRHLLIGLCLVILGACGAPDPAPRTGSETPAPTPTAPGLAAPAAPAAQAGPRATHVVVLVIDGARWSETFGDPARALIPRMAGELAPLGAVWTDFANDGPTYTEAGHAALTTGFYQEIDNRGHDLPKHPGLPQLVVQAAGGTATAAAVITTKDKLATLADCADPAWKGRFICHVDSGRGGRGVGAGYREDPETWERVQAILTAEHPRYAIINLKQPDAAGHGKDWAGYLQGIRDGDAIARKLWDLLQADPVYRGTTDLFITNDHGRHLDGHRDGYVSHGDDCAGCRHIMLLGLGPDVPAGAVFAQHRSQIDLAATIAGILGLRLEGSPGHRLDELWAAPAAAH